MEDFVALLIPLTAVVGFFILMLARSPVGKALAERVRGPGAPGGGGPEHDALVQTVEDLRREVGELAERVDFTERLLAKQREAERLGPGPGRAS